MRRTSAPKHAATSSGDLDHARAHVPRSQPVHAALTGLDPRQRRALELIYGEHRTQREVATALEISRRRVARIVATALQTVARDLRSDKPGPLPVE